MAQSDFAYTVYQMAMYLIGCSDRFIICQALGSQAKFIRNVRLSSVSYFDCFFCFPVFVD